MDIYKNHEPTFINIYTNILPFRIFQDVDENKLTTSLVYDSSKYFTFI